MRMRMRVKYFVEAFEGEGEELGDVGLVDGAGEGKEAGGGHGGLVGGVLIGLHWIWI